MAAFPSYVKTGTKTKMTLESGWSDTVSTAGTLHSRQFHNQQFYGIDLIWPGATGQLFNDLLVLYAASPRATFTGYSYYASSPALVLSVKMTAPPQIVENHGGDRYDVLVSLRGWVA